jgi:hypothetical protein
MDTPIDAEAPSAVAEAWAEDSEPYGDVDPAGYLTADAWLPIDGEAGDAPVRPAAGGRQAAAGIGGEPFADAAHVDGSAPELVAAVARRWKAIDGAMARLDARQAVWLGGDGVDGSSHAGDLPGFDAVAMANAATGRRPRGAGHFVHF